ncbi:GIY-YIG nuclease family protein [Desulfoplanes sp.]
MSAHSWYVYMIRCRDNSLYTGVTLDVPKRYKEHLENKGARYTRAKGTAELVFSTPLASKSIAYGVEYRVKRLRKAVKEKIVREQWDANGLLDYLGMTTV